MIQFLTITVLLVVLVVGTIASVKWLNNYFNENKEESKDD